jgi:hypothetical protein
VGDACGYACNRGFFDCNGEAADGCEADEPCSLLASGLVHPLDVAADADHVYVAVAVDLNGGTGYILRVSRLDGAQMVLAQNEWSPRTIAVDGTHVFWANALGQGGVQDARVRKVPVGGGAATTVAGPPMVYGWNMQVVGTTLLWAEQGFVNSYAGGIWAAPVDGSSAASRLPVDVDFVHAVDAAEGTAFWSVLLPNQSSVLESVSLTTGTRVPIAAAQALDIEVHGDTLYYSTPGAIWTVPTTGGTPAMIVGGLVNPVDIEVHDAHLYWVDNGTFGETDGSVMKSDLLGNAVQPIATAQDGPYALAVSGPDLFFVDADAGTLVRMAN